MISNFSLISSPSTEDDQEEECDNGKAVVFNTSNMLHDFEKEPRVHQEGAANVQKTKYDHRMTYGRERQVSMTRDNWNENSCCEGAVVRLKREMLELLKDEFTCCICEEIVIKATVTKCSHMFCAYCLRESKKIRTTCPVCREQRILERPARSVDEFITRMLKLISEDISARRSILIQEREAIKPKRTTRRTTTRSSLMTME